MSEIPETTAFNAQNVLLQRTKRTAKKLPDLITVSLISVVLMVVGGVLGGAFFANHVTQLIFSRFSITTDSLLLFSLFQTTWLWLAAIPVFVLLGGWLKYYERRKLRTLGLLTQHAILKAAFGATLALLTVSSAIALLTVFGSITLEPGTAVRNGYLGLLCALLPGIGLIAQAAAQELLFRGWMLPVIGYRYNWKLGVALSALLYGAFHIFIFQNPLDLLNLFLLGLFLSFYALQEGSIWGPLAFQTVWLWANNNLLSFPLQAQIPANSVFLTVQTKSLPWLSGGNLGLRSSVLMTGILICLSTGLWLFNFYRVGQDVRPDSLAAAGRLRERKARRLHQRSKR